MANKFQKKTLENIVAALNTTSFSENISVSSAITNNLYNLYNLIYSEYNASRYANSYTYRVSAIKEKFDLFANTIEEQIKKKNEFEQPLTVEDIKKDLEYLTKNFDEVKIRKAKNKPVVVITVVTKDIEITYNEKTINFGRFKITIPFSKSGSPTQATVITALDSTELIPHPHVNHKRMCFGDGANAFNSCVYKNLISESFDIVMGVLNNYNGRSPYRKFESYLTIYCAVCKLKIFTQGGDYLDSCPICKDQYICRNCYEYDSTNAINACIKCLTKCNRCSCYFTKTDDSDLCNYCSEAEKKKKRQVEKAEAAKKEEVQLPEVPVLSDMAITTNSEDSNYIVAPSIAYYTYDQLDGSPPAQEEPHYATSINIESCVKCNCIHPTQEHEGNKYCPSCLFKLIAETEGLD
jgi:hypothetical protein